ncbi:MAG: cyclic nucleotide-binding domain-containing protein [Magnetococcus sp. WYHC-3]
MENAEVAQLLQEQPDIQTLDVEEGNYLIREGESQSDVFLVTRGAFVVEQQRSAVPGGAPGHLATVAIDEGSPCFVGEMAWLGSFVRTASVRSTWRLQALRLKPEHMEVILARFPGLTRAMCRQFAERLKATNAMLGRFQEAAAMKTSMLMKRSGEVVIRRGEPATTLYQLVDGTLTDEASDGALLAPDDFPGGFLDLAAYLSGSIWSRTLKADGSATLATIAESSKLAVIRNYPEQVLAAMQKP